MRLPDSRNQKLVLASVLCGLALALSLVDTAVSSFLPFVPGLKLGLANVVSLFAVYALGLPYALMICMVRSFLAALLSGNITMVFFSLAGGIASILVMHALKNRLGMIKVSVLAGVTHNMLQVAVAVLVTSTPQTLLYVPVLVVTGAVSGFAMGLLCKLFFRKTKLISCI